MSDSVNQVLLVGKISRLGSLKYTPSGTAIRDFTLAVPQRLLEKNSVGYFEAQMTGRPAEERMVGLKVGSALKLTGSLWARTFLDRQGRKVNETKVLVDTMVPVEPEQKEKS